MHLASWYKYGNLHCTISQSYGVTALVSDCILPSSLAGIVGKGVVVVVVVVVVVGAVVEWTWKINKQGSD